jgi:hypothetical protein
MGRNIGVIQVDDHLPFGLFNGEGAILARIDDDACMVRKIQSSRTIKIFPERDISSS